MNGQKSSGLLDIHTLFDTISISQRISRGILSIRIDHSDIQNRMRMKEEEYLYYSVESEFVRRNGETRIRNWRVQEDGNYHRVTLESSRDETRKSVTRGIVTVSGQQGELLRLIPQFLALVRSRPSKFRESSRGTSKKKKGDSWSGNRKCGPEPSTIPR